MDDERDNAANGLRGLRARPSSALFDVLRDRYGIVGADDATDLGGSSNLNLLFGAGQKQYAVRVYRPYVTSARLADIHRVRRVLNAGGVPCSSVVDTREGEPWVRLGHRLVEVEDYIASDAKMDSWERLQAGLSLLGRLHALLRLVKVSAAGATPLFANHVEAHDALAWTQRAARRVQSWGPSPEERRLVRTAEGLARLVGEAERETASSLPRQLVHGDFWDNNVFFRDGRVVLITDLDFMGERARIDDLALPLYFASSSFAQAGRLGERIGQMRVLVDAYDAGLDDPLSGTERAALPLAMARQPLWAVGRWLATLDDLGQARRLAAQMPPDVEWALRIVHDLGRWQAGFA